MVPPSAPVIPCDEDHAVGPEPAFYYCIDLVDGPLHSNGYVSRGSTSCVGRMFVKLAGGINPRDFGEFPLSSVSFELSGGELSFAFDAVEVLECVSSVVAPCEAFLFEADWKGGGES